MATENESKQNDILYTDDYEEVVDLDELEKKLENDVENELSDLDISYEDRKKIGNPDSLGEVIKDTIWQQFQAQIGLSESQEFIKENNGLSLDLRNSSHIQTTENFAEGKIATHNTEIDYQKRYDDWQSNFQRNEDGSVKTHTTRTGKDEATLVKGARDSFDNDRPTGSVEKGTDMDHTVSAGEIIRDPQANAHLSKEEQIDFANSDANLNEMDSSHNRSKGDKSMDDWLDNPNSKGQKPSEALEGLDKKKEKEYRQKDKEAREEYEKRKKEGEQRSKETGRKTQKIEAKKAAKASLKAVLMSLLADLLREIFSKLVQWFKSAKKSVGTLLDSIKSAISSFFTNIKQHLQQAASVGVMSIVSMIFAPFARLIKSVFTILKQGVKSIKEAISYLKNPENKNKPFSIKLLEISKLVIAGLTGIGAVALGEVFEKLLMNIPGFGFEIPILGSIANIVGIFLGAIVSGVIGAIILNFIDKAISKKLKKETDIQLIEKSNEIIKKQEELIEVKEKKLENTKSSIKNDISERHSFANEMTEKIIFEQESNSNQIKSISSDVEENHRKIEELENQKRENSDYDDLMSDLRNL